MPSSRKSGIQSSLASSTRRQPPFVQPQLAKLVTEAPEGERWAHELKFDGYRMHARIDRGCVQLITARSGLDWTSKYLARAEALKQLPVSRAYLDGELCAVRDDGTTSFSLMQAATDGESAAGLVAPALKSVFRLTTHHLATFSILFSDQEGATS